MQPTAGVGSIRVCRLLAWAALGASAAAPTAAQTFMGAIGGSVRDASGAVVAGANVKVTELTTGIERAASANAEGNYHFAGLPPGSYLVTVSQPGFKELRSSPMILTTQHTIRFDAVLQLGDVTQRVEVAAMAPTVNAENAQIGDVRPRPELLNLPMNTRATHAFLYLTSSNYEGRSVGGLRGHNLNYTIDGVTANAAAWGGSASPMLEAALESVQEIKVMASNNAAEYPDVATLYVTTRAGTNDPHGSAVFDSSNNAFNARNFFAASKPKGPTRHEYGASLGGPAWLPKLYHGRDRTFFFFAWEGQHFPGQSSAVANVPTWKMRSGDFSEVLPRIVLRDPSGGPFPGNLIPAARISSVARRIQEYENFIPPPNFGPPEVFSANYRDLRPSKTHNHRYTVRADHQVRPADSLSLRVNLRQTPLPGLYDGALPAFRRNQYRNTRNAYLSETHVFSPELVNEFRFGFARDHSRLEGIHRGAELVEQWGLEGLNLSNKRGLSGVPRLNYVNFSALYESGTYFWVQESFDVINNLTWVKGRHVAKVGVLLRRNRINISEYNTVNDFGRFDFDGFATGFDYADFLLGLPRRSNRYERAQPRYNRFLESGFFLQDDWRITAKLTFNLGLRYEYFTPPVDKYDMRFAFDFATGNLIVSDQQVLRTLVSPLFPNSIPIVTAAGAGYPSRTLLRGDRNNWGPRLGFAWRPFADGRTVLRGGYGVYYSRLTWSQMDGFMGGPFRSDENFLNAISGGVPLFQFPRPFTQVGTVPTQSVQALVLEPRIPQTQQWSLTVEREVRGSTVVRLSYRGFRINRLLYGGDINKPPPGPDPAQRNFYRYPNFFAVHALQNGGIQKLQALDAAVERKFTRGLTFQAGWTWAKNLSDTPGGEEAGFIENPYDRRSEMADVDLVNRHRFVASALYELPFGSGKRFGADLPAVVRQSLGNWAISAIVIFHTGQFLTPSFSGADPSNTRTTGGRPDRIGNAKLSEPSILRWFDAAAFATPPNGRFGNSARGVIVGPGVANFDFGLFKYLAIREQARLQLRMTATNFFNHPNFGNPVTNISSANVGRITSLRSGDGALGAGARVIRLGLRFDF